MHEMKENKKEYTFNMLENEEILANEIRKRLKEEKFQEDGTPRCVETVLQVLFSISIGICIYETITHRYGASFLGILGLVLGGFVGLVQFLRGSMGEGYFY